MPRYLIALLLSFIAQLIAIFMKKMLACKRYHDDKECDFEAMTDVLPLLDDGRSFVFEQGNKCIVFSLKCIRLKNLSTQRKRDICKEMAKMYFSAIFQTCLGSKNEHYF